MIKKFKVSGVEEVYEDTYYTYCDSWSYMSVTNWPDGNGFDVTIVTPHGHVDKLSFTNSEYEKLVELVNKL